METLPVESPDQAVKPAKGKRGRKPKDPRAVKPAEANGVPKAKFSGYYLIVGRRQDGTREEAARKPTIGQARKFMVAGDSLLRRVYAGCELVRCKTIEGLDYQ